MLDLTKLTENEINKLKGMLEYAIDEDNEGYYFDYDLSEAIDAIKSNPAIEGRFPDEIRFLQRLYQGDDPYRVLETWSSDIPEQVKYFEL